MRLSSRRTWVARSILLTLAALPAGLAGEAPKVDFPIVFVSRALAARPSAASRKSSVERAKWGKLLLRMPDGSIQTLVDGAQALANANSSAIPTDVMEPDVSYEGTKIVFSGFIRGENAYRIFEIGAGGAGLRQITKSDRSVDLSRHGPVAPDLASYDDVDPCYLPDGRICFVSTRYPETAPDGRVRSTNLFIVNPDGTDLHRITTERFGADTPAVDPVTGRIVYSRWWRSAQPMDSKTGNFATPVPPGGYNAQGPVAPPLPAGEVDPETLPDVLAQIQDPVQSGLPEADFIGVNSWFLAGINPDGTDLAMHTGLHLDRQSTQAYRPSLFPDGQLLALFIPETPFLGLPGRNGLRGYQRGAARPVDLGGVQTFDSKDQAAVSFFFASPTALQDGRMLVSLRPATSQFQDYDIFVKESAGALPILLFQRPNTAEVDAVPLLARVLPPVIPDRPLKRMGDQIPRTSEEAYREGGSFTFLAENIHFNAPLDFLIPNAPPIGRGMTIEFYTSPQRTGTSKAADPPILLRRAEITPGGRIEVELPAGVPLFEVLRRPDDNLVVGRDGQVFHVGGFNFGNSGQTARCVGCHAGHTMISMPSDPSWTNLAPSAKVSAAGKYRTLFRGEAEAFEPRSLVDRSTRRHLQDWVSTDGQLSPEFHLRFALPIQSREVALYGQPTGYVTEKGKSLLWSFKVSTTLGGSLQEQVFTTQTLSRDGVRVSLDPGKDFDALLLTVVGMELQDGLPFQSYQGSVLPGLSEIEVSARASSTPSVSDAYFLRGDANCDQEVNLSDAISLLGSLFNAKGAPCCQAAADANGDASTDVSDCVFIMDYLFRSGAEPPAPFPSCGPGPDGGLGCDRPSC